MALPKVMGIETEYGITVRNQADFNPILSSLLLINSYETYRTARIRWDYEAESPLRDARGFEYAEEKELPSKEESRLINLILPNGARFYVDHAHPEYSTPECTNPRDLVIWDRAGERIVQNTGVCWSVHSCESLHVPSMTNPTVPRARPWRVLLEPRMPAAVPFASITSTSSGAPQGPASRQSPSGPSAYCRSAKAS